MGRPLGHDQYVRFLDRWILLLEGSFKKCQTVIHPQFDCRDRSPDRKRFFFLSSRFLQKLFWGSTVAVKPAGKIFTISSTSAVPSAALEIRYHAETDSSCISLERPQFRKTTSMLTHWQSMSAIVLGINRNISQSIGGVSELTCHTAIILRIKDDALINR